jgi:[ribosomal protein S5]-alanine N-acetyltransferase
MQFIPIDIDESQNTRFRENPECIEILNVYPAFYHKVGYHKPWIGYFFTMDGTEIAGVGGYKGKPVDGTIEIAYGTFENYRKRGLGTEICRQLVLLALQTDPSVRITARTLPQNNASVHILKRNGFAYKGVVYDVEDGEVWEWEYQKPAH